MVGIAVEIVREIMVQVGVAIVMGIAHGVGRMIRF